MTSSSKKFEFGAVSSLAGPRGENLYMIEDTYEAVGCLHCFLLETTKKRINTQSRELATVFSISILFMNQGVKMIFVVEDCRVSVWSLSPLTDSAASPGDLDEGDVVIKLYSVTNKYAVHLGNACFTKYGFGFIDVSDEEYLSKC